MLLHSRRKMLCINITVSFRFKCFVMALSSIISTVEIPKININLFTQYRQVHNEHTR